MIFIAKQSPFTCEYCGKDVQNIEHGSYRNHCPYCLYSKHVDDEGPGDRASSCGGLMKPIELQQHKKKGFVVVHLCEICGKKQSNKAADDDNLDVFF